MTETIDRYLHLGAERVPPPPNFEDEDKLPELWELSGTIPEYKHRGAVYKDLPVLFFIESRPGEEPSMPYHLAIKDYKKGPAGSKYAELYIQELFTPGEMESFISWMEEYHPETADTLKKKRVDLPIENNIGGVMAIPTGGGQDFYMLSKEEAYDLPFNVWFYFDVRHQEPVYPHFEAETTREKIWQAGAIMEVASQASEALSAMRALQEKIAQVCWYKNIELVTDQQNKAIEQAIRALSELEPVSLEKDPRPDEIPF